MEFCQLNKLYYIKTDLKIRISIINDKLFSEFVPKFLYDLSEQVVEIWFLKLRLLKNGCYISLKLMCLIQTLGT